MTVILQDTFAGRTVGAAGNPTGFGTSSDGHTWAQITGFSAMTGTCAVGSNEGQFINNAGGTPFRGWLGNGSVASAAADVKVRFKLATGTDFVGIFLRTTDSSHFLLIRRNGAAWQVLDCPSGTTTTTDISSAIGVTPVAGTFYWLRVRAVGTNVQCKVWQDGNAEPAFQSSTTVGITQSGSFGLYGMTSSGAATMNVDSFLVDDATNTLNTNVRATFSIAAVLKSSTRAKFSVATNLKTTARATFKVATGLITQGRAIFDTSARLNSGLRSTFLTSAHLDSDARAKFNISVGLRTQARSTFSVSSALRSLAQATFKIAATGHLLMTSAQVTFKTAAHLQSTARAAFKTSAQLRTLARSTFKINSPVGVVYPLKVATAKSVTRLAATFATTRWAFTFADANRLIATFSRSTPMAQPNSVIDVTSTVTENGAAATMTEVAVTVTFPDGSTQAYSLGSGVTSLGNGQFKLTYTTKDPGEHRELWSFTATDGSTAQYLNTTGVWF